MPEFLAEAYVPCSEAATDRSQAKDLAQAADRMTRHGRPVRLTGCIVVPEDEIGLYLFRASSAEAVSAAAASCGVRFERVVEAVSGWQPAANQPSTEQGEQQ